MPETVLGLGIDLVSVSRFKQAVDRWGNRFMNRIFTPGELEYCNDRARPEIHLAARFAAKEAFLKALGTGYSRGISFRDVEIISDGATPPKITLHNEALVISVANGLKRFLVSLTHNGDYAAACVVTTGVFSEDHYEQQGL